MKILDGNISREEKIKSFNKRIVRWEAYRVNFLSFIINLILTLTGGSLVFWYHVLKDQQSYCCNCLLFTAGLMLAFSFAFGIATMLNRLCDFRLTVEKIRLERRIFDLPRASNKHRRSLNEMKTQTKKIGKRTHLLLNIQAGLFAIGNLIVFLSIMMTHD